MARNKVMAARNNTNQISGDDLGLCSSTKIGQVRVLCRLTPRLQELLYVAKSHQTNYYYKYYWAKESTIFLRKTDGFRVIKLGTKEDLDNIRLREPNDSTDQSKGPC